MEFEEVKTDMKFLGTYKKEFESMIREYVNICNQLDKAWEEFVAEGMKSVVECAGGVKKNPQLIAIEDLRKQKITYSDRLGLSPKSLDQIKNANITEEKTGLEKALEMFNEKFNG